MTTEVELNGVEGSNLLAFLAALGALITFTDRCPDRRARLRWCRSGGAWRPRLSVNDDLSPHEVVTTLDAQLRADPASSPLDLGADLNVSAERFRDVSGALAEEASLVDRRAVDLVAAFGSDGVIAKDGVIEDTAFRTMSGAGHQHFLGFMRQLVRETTADHIRSALFQPWRYDDPAPSLRWDPMDDRRYALRWREPSGDPIRTVRGANRLAIEGLRFFPTVPHGARLETAGFTGHTSRDTYFTWPIWTGAATCDAIASLLSQRALQETVPDRQALRPMGVEEVYRSRRITRDKYRNFSPGLPV